MPDIGISIMETCLASLSELPFEDAIAALDYIHRRLSIRENRRRILDAQKQKLGRDPTEEEAERALDEWDRDPDAEVAGPGTGGLSSTLSAYPPTHPPPFPPSTPGYAASAGAVAGKPI